MTYNNQLDNREFRFFLNFKNDNIGLLEISEPVKFDASSFVIEQDKKRYGRDVYFMNEEISLEFYSDYFTPSTQQITLPNGELVNHLTHGFEFIKQYYREFGFESEVELILRKNNIDFITGVLDFQTADTDELTYFKFKVIQNTKQAQIKRREDVQVDLFSDEDLDGNAITPIQTKDIFLKAKPVVQKSAFKMPSTPIEIVTTGQYGNFGGTGLSGHFNPAQLVLNYGIKDTLSFLDNEQTVTNFRVIRAEEELTNIKIDYDVQLTALNTGGAGIWSFRYIVVDQFFVDNGAHIYNNSIPIYSSPLFNSGDTQILNLNNSYTINLIPKGSFLLLFFRVQKVEFGTTSSLFTNTFTKCAFNITATSTAISSVIKGVRHIDLIKQVTKSINGMEVIAPKYDVGGAFYDNFVFNGKLIRQFTDEPFYAKFKDAVGQLEELNSDYQINQENVYIGQYNDYYNNNEVSAYLQAPDSDYKSNYNNRYAINTMEYSYKSFEQDRDESNTIDAVHTNTQWLLPNKQVENNLKINVDYVRDPFEIESARRQGINTKETTSLSNDDKIYIIDCVALAPNTRNVFTAPLQYNIIAGNANLQILSDGTFNWSLLGFRVNDTILIGSTSFASYSYKVLSIDSTILTLQFLSFLPIADSSGISVLTFDYAITAAGFINRTNQEFQIIENVANSDNYSNLQYTIKRNLKYYESYLACASKYKLNGVIKNTYFKSNGELITEFRNGGLIKENEDINVSDLETRLIEPIIITTKVVAEYNDVLDTLIKMQTINTDESIGGFIRVVDTNNKVINLYPTKLDYNWGTKLLEITGEQKYESDIVEITTENGLIYINKVGYDEQIVKPMEVKTSGEYIQLFDFRGIALINEIKFTNIFVNSNNFSNIVELTDVLLNL